MVPLFGLTLTSLSVSTLLALRSDDNLSAITVLSALCFYHIGVAWLFGHAETAAIDARFPATQVQIDLMGNNGAMYGAVFHLIEGGITIWGLLVAIEQNQSSTSSSDSSKADWLLIGPRTRECILKLKASTNKLDDPKSKRTFQIADEWWPSSWDWTGYGHASVKWLFQSYFICPFYCSKVSQLGTPGLPQILKCSNLKRLLHNLSFNASFYLLLLLL